MKRQLLYILILILFTSCQQELKKISEEDQYNFFLENLICTGQSTAPSYISVYLINNDKSVCNYLDTMQVCVDSRFVTGILISIDSTIIINGSWNEEKLLQITKNRSIYVNDSIFCQASFYSIDDTIKMHALELLIKEKDIDELFLKYKNEISEKELETLSNTISPIFRSFRTMLQHYLFVYGIETYDDCEGRGVLLGSVYK